MKHQHHEKGNGQEPLNANEVQQDSPASDFEQKNMDGWRKLSDGDVIKLEIGESIKGELISKNTSSRYNDCGIYKIMVPNDPVPKVILGSRQLDRIMETAAVGTHLTIIYTGKKPSDKGNPMKIFDVYVKDNDL
jgi:hypothetical protein